MRFMMLMYPGAKAEAGKLPDARAIEAMTRYNEELTKAGIVLAMDGLQPSSKGARVHFGGGRPTVVDGPFAEAKELLGGYWLIQVRSKDEALEWAKRCPASDGETIEIRQVFELADFTNLSPDQVEAVEALGANLPKR